MSEALGSGRNSAGWEPPARPWRTVALKTAGGSSVVCSRASAVQLSGLRSFTQKHTAHGCILATWRVDTLPTPYNVVPLTREAGK